MQRTLRVPFATLQPYHFLAAGSGAHVYIINDAIVFKTPLSYNNPDDEDIADRKAGIESLEREKVIYQTLKKVGPAHPNIIRCYLIVPQGIFLERLDTTLEFRNRDRDHYPVNENKIVRWTKQLIGAVAFLEQLGLIHGDLRPANILINKDDHVKLTDFGDTVTPGERLRSATPGFSQVCDLKTFRPCIASYKSEQLAIGSCIFAISTGTEPLQGAKDQVRRFYLNDFPSTESVIFDKIIQACWKKSYASISVLKDTIDATVRSTLITTPIQDDSEWQFRLQECDSFLEENKGSGNMNRSNGISHA